MPPVSNSMPPMPPSSGYNQPPLPPSSGYNQPPLPPSSNYNHPPLPPSSGYNQPPLPPSSGYGMPPAPNGVNPGGSQAQSPSGRFGADTGSISRQLGGLSVTNTGFQKMWGQESIDLLQNRHILPPGGSSSVLPSQSVKLNHFRCSEAAPAQTTGRAVEQHQLQRRDI